MLSRTMIKSANKTENNIIFLCIQTKGLSALKNQPITQFNVSLVYNVSYTGNMSDLLV